MLPVPLTRQFTFIPEPYQKDDLPLDDLLPSIERGEQRTWDELEEEYRVVILADAGAGKTFELRAAAERLRSRGKAAFFIRIEDIDAGFSDAFEIGSRPAFDEWLAGDEDAWFFLDSVDEIRLSHARAFETAMGAFAARVRTALQRAHIYISSRPYAWRTSADRALIEELLPFDTVRRVATTDDDLSDQDGSADAAVATVDEIDTPGRRLALYLLAALSDNDVRLFARHGGVADVRAFMSELELSTLHHLARTPFDLQDLISAWLADPNLGSRLSVLQDGVRRQLLLAAGLCASPTVERALDAVRLLAIAAVLTGHTNIALPGSVVRDAIDPAELFPDWDSGDLSALLSSGVFGDPIYGEVRFRHREVRELLAAEWIASHLERSGGRRRIASFLNQTSHGHEILPPRLRPLFPWLVLFDDAIRDHTLALRSEIATEGGDPGRLPVEVRRGLLAKLIGEVIAPGSRLRGIETNALARIATPDLEQQTLALINQHHGNDDAMFVLTRLVWQGKMRGALEPLLGVMADATRNIDIRIVSVRAVAEVGSAEQFYDRWQNINASEAAIPRRLLAEIADRAPPSRESIPLLLRSIDLLEPRQEFEVTGLTRGLNAFIAALPILADPAEEQPLFVLAQGLQKFLEREPHVEAGKCRVSEEYQWLMSAALHCIERLVENRLTEALSDSSLTILAMAPALRFWRSDDYQGRKSVVEALVPNWSELNDALYWWTVADCRRNEKQGERLVNDWPISFIEHVWSFDAAAFPRVLEWVAVRDLPDDRLVALSRAFAIYASNDRPAAWLALLKDAVAGQSELEQALDVHLAPAKSPEAMRWERDERAYRRKSREQATRRAKDRADFVARVTADPGLVFLPDTLPPGALSTVQYHLLQIVERQSSNKGRAQGADWEALIPEFGQAVAEAYRDAAVAHWRVYRPGLRSEGTDTNTIPYALIFAMAGLDIELRDEAAPAALTQVDARLALRYSMWELNGFPRWFEGFYQAWPGLCLDFIWGEIEWELLNSPADVPLHYVLSDLVYYGAWLRVGIAPRLYAWIAAHHPPNDETLRRCRTVLLDGITAEQIADLARAKISDVTTPPSQLPIWFAMWVDADPLPALLALQRHLEGRPLPEASPFAQMFVVGLLGGRQHGGETVFGKFRTPTVLKQLYLLMHETIPVSEDIERAGKGVYSASLRDDARDARERLLELLTRRPEALAYNALVDLADTHPVTGYRDYLRVRAYERAVEDGDLPDWALSDVADLAGTLEALPLVPSGGNG